MKAEFLLKLEPMPVVSKVVPEHRKTPQLKNDIAQTSVNAFNFFINKRFTHDATSSDIQVRYIRPCNEMRTRILCQSSLLETSTEVLTHP